MDKQIEPQATPRPGFFASLVYPDYRRLWSSAAFIQSAGWALIIARAPLALEATDSTTWIGIITFAAMVPSVLLNPIGGYLADKWDRRTLLTGMYSFNVLSSLVLAILVVGGVIHGPGGIWYLLVLALFDGSARAIQLPTAQALLPNLVPKERLLNAIALNQAALQGARMAGSLAMLPLVLTVGPGEAFFVPVALYVLGVFQVRAIQTASTGVVTAEKGMFQNLVVGIHYVYTHPVVLSVILLAVAHCALTMAFEALFPLFAREQLGMSEGRVLFVGPIYLMIGVGTGAVLATTLGLGRVHNLKTRGSLFFWVGILSGITPLGLAFAPNIPLAVLAAAGIGASTAAFMTLTNATIQSIVPDGVRGRVSSVNMWHTFGIMAGFNLVNPVLTEVSWINASVILTATGVLFVVVMVGSLLRLPLREIYSKGLPAVGSHDLRPSLTAFVH